MLGFFTLIIGNVFIFPKIYQFKSDYEPLWKICNCMEFKQKYSTSQEMYEYSTYAILSFCAIQIMMSLWYFCSNIQQKNASITPININDKNFR